MSTTTTTTATPASRMGTGFTGTALCTGSEVTITGTISDPDIVAVCSRAGRPDVTAEMMAIMRAGAITYQLLGPESQVQTVATAATQSADQIGKALTNAVTMMDEQVQAVADPEHGQLAQVMAAYSKTVEASLGAEDSPVSRRVRKDLADVKTAVQDVLNMNRRIMTEQLDLSDPSSPMARLHTDVNKQLAAITGQVEDLTKAVAVANTTASVAAKTTLHGISYEDQVLTSLAEVNAAAGDGFVDTSDTPGTVARCKTGDAVATISLPDRNGQVRVVYEAKTKTMTGPAWVSELQQALRNREACVAVGVVPDPNLLPNGAGRAAWLQPNLILTAFDPTIDDPAWLRLVHQLARVMAMTYASGVTDTVDLTKVTRFITEARNHLDDLDKVFTKTTSVRSAMDAVDKVTRNSQEAASRALQEALRVMTT